MNYQLLSALVLVAALLLYAPGFTGGGRLALVLAVVLEAWFWVRVIRGKRS